MTKKKGYWKEHLLLYGCWICSNCNKHIYNNFGVHNLENYCPKCGARMQKRGINKVEDKFNRVFCGKNPTKEQAAIIANVGLEFILGLRHILDSNEVQIVHKETIYSILGED